METNKIKEVFDNQFKFKVGDEVRHKGDSKEYLTADMGLLIMNRIFVETVDDDGNSLFERSYHCRCIKFSGSGDVVAFREKELLSKKDWERKRLIEKRERDEMYQNGDLVEREVFGAFGVKRLTKVYIKDESGNFDTSKVFQVTGFDGMDSETYKLSLREVGGLESKRKTVKVILPSDIQILQNQD